MLLALAGALVVFTVGAGPAVAHPKCGIGVIEPGEMEAEHEDEENCNLIEIEAGESTFLELGEPVGDAVNGDTFGGPFVWSPNMTPTGFTARSVPTSGTGANLYNSDLAFWGNLAVQGTYAGFRLIDISNPADPMQLINYTGCSSTAGQGDVNIWGNLVFRSYDSPANATATCGGVTVGSGWEGVSIFDVSNPAAPALVRHVRMASSGNGTGAPTGGCGSHTATLVPDVARGNVYLYVGGSSGCSPGGMDIVRVPLANPADAAYLRRVATGRQCHDNSAILGDVNLAACAGGNGFTVMRFDPTIDADAVGGIANPAVLYQRTVTGVSIGHSASFSWDGKVLIFGHEPGGGSQAQCQASSSTVNRSIFFFEPLTGNQLGSFLHPRPQTAQENCTWHNFNVVPTKTGYVFTSGNYQSGIYVVNFTDPSNAQLVGFADPARLGTGTGITLGGDWSTYWYNGHIWESDIRRGLISWKLDDPLVNVALTLPNLNPQVQETSFALDVSGPEINLAAPLDGDEYVLGSTVLADFECVDPDLATCVGTVADGQALDTSTIGFKSFVVTATDTNGNTSSRSVTYNVAWPFEGFLAPINDHNSEVIHPAKAGTTIPVRFRLGGDRGMDVVQPGSPTAILPGPGHGGHGGEMGDCEYPVEVVDPATSVGGTGLQYRNGEYVFLWQTSSSWKGQCRMLIFQLADNTEHMAMFMFDEAPDSASLTPLGTAFRCHGSVGAITVNGDVSVAAGDTCALVGTTVKGSLKVKAGATLTTESANVTKGVECAGTCVLLGSGMAKLFVDRGALAIVTGSAVNGEAECNDCAALDLRSSSVIGNVSSLRQTQPGIYCGNTIGGGLSFRFSSQSLTTCTGNTIGDKLEVSNNAGTATLSIVGNRVGKAIRVEHNTVGGITLTGNTAGKPIACVGNTPPPTSSGNVAPQIDKDCKQS